METNPQTSALSAQKAFKRLLLLSDSITGSLARQQCAAQQHRKHWFLPKMRITVVEEAWRLLLIVHRFPVRSYWLRLTIALPSLLCVHNATRLPALVCLFYDIVSSFRSILLDLAALMLISLSTATCWFGAFGGTIHLSLFYDENRFYKPIRLRRLCQPWPEIEMQRRISSGLLQRVLLY